MVMASDIFGRNSVYRTTVIFSESWKGREGRKEGRKERERKEEGKGIGGKIREGRKEGKRREG